jgi:tRNA A37 threonylcarbamoyladenosine biosynthesis protein TsaE
MVESIIRMVAYFTIVRPFNPKECLESLIIYENTPSMRVLQQGVEDEDKLKYLLDEATFKSTLTSQKGINGFMKIGLKFAMADAAYNIEKIYSIVSSYNPSINNDYASILLESGGCLIPDPPRTILPEPPSVSDVSDRMFVLSTEYFTNRALYPIIQKLFTRLMKNDIVIVGNGIDMKKLPMSLKVLNKIVKQTKEPSFNKIIPYRGTTSMKNHVDTWEVGELESAISMKVNTKEYSWMTSVELAEWKHTTAHLHLPDFQAVFGYAIDGTHESSKSLKVFVRANDEDDNSISFMNNGSEILSFDLPI